MKRAITLLCLLSLFALPAAAATHIWTGESSRRFSDEANWEGGSPAEDAAADLSFPATARRVEVMNDLPALTVRSIVFSGSGYHISGQAITLAATAQIGDASGGEAPDSPTTNELAVDLLAASAVVFDVESRSNLIVRGGIRGDARVTKLGWGTVVFAGAQPNEYSGGTSVLDGALLLAKSSGVTAIRGTLHIATDAVVKTLADEQLEDTASLLIDGRLIINAKETLGPLTLRGGELQALDDRTDFAGTLPAVWLGGDIVISGRCRLEGLYLWLLGRRTITCDHCGGTKVGELAEVTPGTGLIVRGRPSDGEDWLEILGDYRGATLIESGSVELWNRNTAVRLRGGRFSGRAASLVVEGAASVHHAEVEGEIRLSSSTVVEARWEGNARGWSGPLLMTPATLSLHHARLDVTNIPDIPRDARRKIAVAGKVEGTFLNAAQDTILHGLRYFPDEYRLRIHYDGDAISLQDVTRIRTDMSLQPPVQSVPERQTITITARITSTRPVSSGIVELFEQDRSIGRQAVSAAGTASFIVQPPLASGTYQYEAVYYGTDELAASKASAGVTVTVPPATLTAIEPAVVESGSRVDLVLRGTGFRTDGLVTIGNKQYMPSSITPEEVRISVFLEALSTDQSPEVWVEQYSPESWTRSNSLSMTVRGRVPEPVRITREGKTLSGRIAPGETGTWLATYYAGRRHDVVARTEDADHDGNVSLVLEATSTSGTSGTFLLVDPSDREVQAANGYYPALIAEPPYPLRSLLFLRDSEGSFSQVIASGRLLPIFDPPPSFDVVDWLWVRAGVGSWHLRDVEGGRSDHDGAVNGHWVLKISEMLPVDGSPPPPPGIEPGDFFLGLQHYSWFGGRVTDAQLRHGDAAGSVVFAERWVEVNEDAEVARVVVMRLGGSEGEISVRYHTEERDVAAARAGRDYRATSGVLTFAPGEILETIEIPIFNDAVWSDSRSFRVVLTDPVDTEIPSPSLSVSIREDDPLPELRVTGGTFSEGDEGMRTASFLLSLSRATVPVTVRWSVEGSDLMPTSGTISFLPGDTTPYAIPVGWRADPTPGLDRRIVLNASGVFVVTGGAAAIHVLDDDPEEISLLDVTVHEGAGEVVVDLSSLESPLSIAYRTESGTATAGVDFTPVSGTVTTTGTLIKIPIVQDALVEGPETFTVVVSSPSRGRLVRDRAVVVIKDDDADVLPHLVSGPLLVHEGETAIVTLRLNALAKREVRFRLSTSAGTASERDYEAKDVFLTIPPGKDTVAMPIRIFADPLIEGTEIFTIALSQATGARILSPLVRVSILDLDRAEAAHPAAIVQGFAILEGTDAVHTKGEFTVSIAASAETVTLPCSTADGTAFADEDYFPIAPTLTFQPGETVKTVNVSIVADDDPEPDERFTLVCGSAAGVAEIRNDEVPGPKRRSAGP